MIFQHDGCRAHYRITVRQPLNLWFPNKWIGRGAPIPWPAKSLDLTSSDFYVWGHMKDIIYKDEIDTGEQLINKIREAAEIIRNNFPNTVTRAEIRKQARACIRNRGSHFENIL